MQQVTPQTPPGSALTRTAVRWIVAGIAAVALIVGVAAVLSGSQFTTAAPTVSGATVFLADPNTERVYTPDTVLEFTQNAIGLSDGAFANIDTAVFAAPDGATAATTFIAPPGSEADSATWIAYTPTGFTPGTRDLVYPDLTPGYFEQRGTGTVLDIQEKGGTYSVGFVFTDESGAVVGAPCFTTITVTPGSGDWTFATP